MAIAREEIQQLSQEEITRIFKEDRQLEGQESQASVALMKHRWHWTLDESNPQRMSLRAYAKLVGRSYTTIVRYAKGFYYLTDGDTVNGITPEEARERAGMSADMEDATDAYAQNADLAFTTAHTTQYRGEVRQVLDGARKQAEEKGTSVKSEAPAVAQDLSLQRRLREEKTKSEERKKHQPSGEERRKQYRYHYNDVNYQLEQARQHLVRVEQLTGGIGNNFDDDHRNFLSHKLNEVRRLVDSLDQTILGGNTPDWGDKVLVMTGSTSN